MSLIGGCGLCGTENSSSKNLSQEDFEIICPILSSFNFSSADSFTTNNYLDWNGLNSSQVVFCPPCQSLLKEMKRLQFLVKLVTSQLDDIVEKVKVKYAKRPVWVKPEQITNDTADSAEYDEDDFLIEPLLEVKLETDEVTSNEDDEGDDFQRQSDSFSEESNSSPDKDDDDDDEPRQESQIGKKRRKKHLEIPRTKPKASKSRSESQPKRLPRSGRDYFLCHFCDLTVTTKEDKFLHHETIHLEGAHDLNEGGTTRLYSSICGKSSLIPGQITAHNETFHPDHFQKFICPSCKPEQRSQFTSRGLLKAHKVIHTTTSSSFPCILCKEESPMTFCSAVDLDNHLRRVHFHALKASTKAIRKNRIGPECDNPPISREETQGGGKQKGDPCRFCGIQKWKWGIFRTRGHERKEHPEKFVHLCNHPNCGESYGDVNELLTCQETHKTCQKGPFKCYVCNGKYTDSLTLREHLEAKHSKGGFKCDSCEERVLCPLFLAVHKAKVHGGEWPHKCPICGKGAENTTQIDNHIRAQHKDQQQYDQSVVLPSFILCELCPAKFASKKALVKHKQKDHLGIVKTYSCGQCGNSYKTAHALKAHEKSHLGIKDHICHICGKGFAKAEVLKIHMRVHTGEKPHVCHICSKGFSQRTPLKKHLDTHKQNGT